MGPLVSPSVDDADVTGVVHIVGLLFGPSVDDANMTGVVCIVGLLVSQSVSPYCRKRKENQTV